MTRFIIKSKTYGDQTITVDESDAYILRSHTWHARKAGGGQIYFFRKGVGGEQVHLHRYLADAKESDMVRFSNSNSFDLRRSNLIKQRKDDGQLELALFARQNRNLYKAASS